MEQKTETVTKYHYHTINQTESLMANQNVMDFDTNPYHVEAITIVIKIGRVCPSSSLLINLRPSKSDPLSTVTWYRKPFDSILKENYNTKLTQFIESIKL